MIIRCHQCRAIQRPLFFAINSYWNHHLIRYLPMMSSTVGLIFRGVIGSLYGFYRTVSPKIHSVKVLPGGFKNPNNFCFGHALFQVLFASKKFIKYFSPSEHRLNKYRNETMDCLLKRQKLQQDLNNIRQKIYNHKTISSTDSYRLRHQFHLVNREIPERGQWDLCEFSDNLFEIIQSPSMKFNLTQTKNILPHRFSVNSFYLNPSLLNKIDTKEAVSIHSIPLFASKIESIPEDPDVMEQLPKITLENVIFNSHEIPNYLTVQISRFNLNEYQSNHKNSLQLKDVAKLNFPLDDSTKKVNYELIGSCEHDGSLKGGHYYSIIRYLINGKREWVKCDSSSVSRINSQKLYNVVGRKGCFYFYERV